MIKQISQTPISFFAGATYPCQAFVILSSNPRLWGYVILPILVNLVVGIGLYVALLFPSLAGIDTLVVNLEVKINNLITGLPAWLMLFDYLAVGLGWLLRLILVTGLLLAIGFLLVQFGVVLGAHWYGQLSEQLEEIRTGKLPKIPSNSIKAIFEDLSRALSFEVKKLLLGLQIGIPLLLINFLPGLGSAIASIGGVILGATLICLDFLDAPLERRRLEFREKLKMIRQSLPASASFGLVCLGLNSIPILNLLTIPLCVAAGTLFFCDRIAPIVDDPTSK